MCMKPKRISVTMLMSSPTSATLSILLLACSAAVPSCAPVLPVELLRVHLLGTAGDAPGVRLACIAAFASGVVGAEQ